MPTANSIAKKRQKNLVQYRITQTTPERGPGEIDLTNLPDKEFNIKVTTMLMDRQRNMQELKEQAGRENTEIKQSLEGLKSRLDEVQETVKSENKNTEKLRQREIKGSPGIKEY